MTTNKIPNVVSSGVVKIGDLEFTVHQLDNGQRVIDADDMDKIMRWMGADATSEFLQRSIYGVANIRTPEVPR